MLLRLLDPLFRRATLDSCREPLGLFSPELVSEKCTLEPGESGFGAFSVRHRKSRVGRNPRTGTSVQVSEKKVPFFKMGKGMRERLNR